jgi:beta-lactam-binding protein with PASTA domain
VNPSDEWPTRVDDTVTRAAPPTPPPYPPEEPDSPLGRGMVLALLVIALAVVGALAGWLVTHRGGSTQTTTVISRPPARTSGVAGASKQLVAVPELIGLTKQKAVIQLGGVGLRPRIQVRSSGPRDGLVVEQRPVGTQKAVLGSPVLVLVDRPPAPRPAKHATPTKVTTTVVTTATTVPATTTTPQSAITGAQTTTSGQATTAAPQTPQASIPDVSGRPEAAAVDALYQAGLLVDLVFVPSSDDLGTVESQSKPAGTTLPARTHVQLNLSGGNGKFPPETVPNVVGKTLHDAVSTLNGAQLRLIYVKLPVMSRASDGKIVRQTPLAGHKAPQHGQVLVYLGVLKP